MRCPLRDFIRDDRGQSIYEYGLLIACFCVVIVAVVKIFGPSVAAWIGTKTSAITSF